MNDDKIFITNSFEETQNLGKEFVSRSEILLRRTKGPRVIALYGDLGSGKTIFVQGLASGLGIKRRIISPTFIIVRSYKIKIKNPARLASESVAGRQKSIIKNPNFAKASLGRQNSKFFYHIDLYRTETADDIRGLGIDEIIGNSNNIIVVEWAEKMREFLPKKRIDIYFEYLDENKRKIKFINNGTSN